MVRIEQLTLIDFGSKSMAFIYLVDVLALALSLSGQSSLSALFELSSML